MRIGLVLNGGPIAQRFQRASRRGTDRFGAVSKGEKCFMTSRLLPQARDLQHFVGTEERMIDAFRPPDEGAIPASIAAQPSQGGMKTLRESLPAFRARQAEVRMHPP